MLLSIRKDSWNQRCFRRQTSMFGGVDMSCMWLIHDRSWEAVDCRHLMFGRKGRQARGWGRKLKLDQIADHILHQHEMPAPVLRRRDEISSSKTIKVAAQSQPSHRFASTYSQAFKRTWFCRTARHQERVIDVLLSAIVSLCLHYLTIASMS